jgi:hypothetical protein
LSNHCKLPFHFYVKVSNKFLGKDLPEGYTNGIWHGIYSRKDQTLLLHIMLETGAHWSGVPIHGISLTEQFNYSFNELMPWASMGDEIQCVHFPYLEGLRCNTINSIQESGRHTGLMIDWYDGYSRYPQEHKPLNLIALDVGQFCLMPNNYVLYEDKHFILNENKEDLKHYLRGEEIYWGE